MMEMETAPFLQHRAGDEHTDALGLPLNSGTRKLLNRKVKLLAWLNVAQFALCVVLLCALVYMSSGDSGVSELYSPANSAVRYEHRVSATNDTIFVGHPGPAWSEAMQGLLEGTLIKVTKGELELAGTESIPLRDGDFAAGLGVAHNIHCVKKLKQFVYFDQFYPGVDLNGPEHEEIRHHADHCLDLLRQSIMCHVDVSLYALAWREKEDGQLSLRHRYPEVQKCVNWERVQAWMQSRATSSDQLLHPPSSSGPSKVG